MRGHLVARAFALLGICVGCFIASGCGGGGGASVAPAVQATVQPTPSGTTVGALAVVYSGQSLVVSALTFQAEVMALTSSGSVIANGTVLAYPIAVSYGGGCGQAYSMTTLATTIPMQSWPGATPQTGCTGTAFTLTAATTSSTGKQLSAGPIPITNPAIAVAVGITGLTNLSQVPSLTIPVFQTYALNPTYTIVSSTCPAGSLTGGSSLVLTPPLQAFTCSASLTVGTSGGYTPSYALSVTST